MGGEHVVLLPAATRALRRMPKHIEAKLQMWVALVEATGIREVRRIPGFHDEPLTGTRRGQRAIRLSKGYRAFYTVHTAPTGDVITIEEVTKHVY